MKKIGITGSLASGKTTASKFLSRNKGPLFSADLCVKKLYSKKNFKILIAKKIKLKNTLNIKQKIRNKISKDKNTLKKLEKIIHPLVRSEMRIFARRNRSKKLIFFEIPLLIESKLMRNFDIIFFINAKKAVRIKRFIRNGGSKKLFNTLNNKQLNARKKFKFCDYVINNNKNKNVLKKSLLQVLKKYE
tara:strand:+ start:1877 stop:2443 length:567 start_codon:yes stop_codon:yes gene_type:complete